MASGKSSPIPDDPAAASGGGDGGISATAPTPPRRGAGGRVGVGVGANNNNNNNNVRRGRRPGGVVVVRLLAVLSVSVLVGVATVVRYHVGLGAPSDRNAGGGGVRSSSSSSLSGRKTIPPPPPSSSSRNRKRRRRVRREINSLEEELKTLSDEYLEISKQVSGLVSAKEGRGNEAQPSKTHDGADVSADRKKLEDRTRARAEQERKDQFDELTRKAKKVEPQRGEDSAAAPLKPPPQPASETRKRGRAEPQEPRRGGGGAASDARERPRNREPKKWWTRKEIFADIEPSDSEADRADDAPGSIVPVNLSVNHLQRVDRAAGSPDDGGGGMVPEEFLPVVLPGDVDLRWRSRARPGSRPGDVLTTRAYRVEVRRAASGGEEDSSDVGEEILWDSGRVAVEELPDVVECRDPRVTSAVGSVLEWRVTVWDSSSSSSSSGEGGGGGGRPAASEWTRFAIGPSQDGWRGKWISHPIDLENRSASDAGAFWGGNKYHQELACENWERRAQLPVFRARLSPGALSGASDEGGGGEEDEIASALLVASGLGSFRASVDGRALSSSGPLDPPLTDFAQRVMYRGFDVTKFLTGEGRGKEHVVGISMGSGWWDHRPIGGSFIRLFYFPHGAVTCVAQLYVTYKRSGRTKVLLATGDESSGWQVAKGHLRESSLFSGEYVDLRAMAEFDGWDTDRGWDEDAHSDSTGGSDHAWVSPRVYESDTTLDSWRKTLEMKSNARHTNGKHKIVPDHKLSPVGKLVPHEIPPVMPVERIQPDEVYSLGNGRWMLDFGKGVSGMVRFDDGLPSPIVPEEYPRGHSVSTLGPDEAFVTVVYGDSLEIHRGDINIAVVAGMGLHDGGPMHKAKKAGDAEKKGGPCYPKDHVEAGSLLQRDVYILPRADVARDGGGGGGVRRRGSFADARQSRFTTHAFRFAEVCCTATPPSGASALAYRTAFEEWGDFGSSNARVNGGYELVRNAMSSNMLGVQSDCPHREKIQYGGDIIADSPSALHLYDMSAFYRKVVRDWADQQWDNGAYAGTSHWLALNDYAGIGTGSGETVWASAPVVTTARHMQHYGDRRLLEESFDNHMRWFDFLRTHFDVGLKAKGYDDELRGYVKEGSGLGDWLTFRGRDTWLTHQGFFMATARAVAYIAARLGKDDGETMSALTLAASVRDRISRLYLRDDGSFLPPEAQASQLSPGPEMSLYSRIVPGEERCDVLRGYFRRKGHTWPGSDENRFVREMSAATRDEMIDSGEVTKRGGLWSMGWSQWHGFNEGIFAVRYALKTLSDNGFHNLALSKANGFGCGTFEYMLSHNATTHWESWWRSEDLYSHNHPMLGASAEWMVAAVAGVELRPTTTGGREVSFWPRFPNSASTIEYAGATQGTRRGDFSVAWKFEGLPADERDYDSAVAKIRVRLFVPPDGRAVFRLPEYGDGEGVDSTIRYAARLPDMEAIRASSSAECEGRRRAKEGFDYNWEFVRDANTWVKVHRKKAIGTPCRSFLFHPSLDDVVAWSSPETVAGSSDNGWEVELRPGLYDVMVDEWRLKPEVKGTKEWRIASMRQFSEAEDIGPYCSDSDTFDWNIGDASYLI